MRSVISLALMTLAVSAAVRQDRVEMVGPTAQIPKNYKSWSLFLVCNADWVEPERSADLANLYRRFNSFGDAIGHDNLAVWFWKRQKPINDPKLAENVDVAKSAEYCKAIQQRPSEGPFVVVTTAYPDLNAFPRERAIFALGGLPPADIGKLFGRLSDQLLLQGRLDAPAPPPPAGAQPTTAPRGAGPAPAATPAPTGFWVRLLEGTRQSIAGVGCKVKVQVNTGVVSAELNGCPGF